MARFEGARARAFADALTETIHQLVVVRRRQAFAREIFGTEREPWLDFDGKGGRAGPHSQLR